jgi:membrane-anchored protein YejM (alkaline phosphatase superfamily)
MDRQKLLDKLYELEKRKAEVTDMKKSMAKDYRDQLKDIDSEIKEVMAELENPAPSIDKAPVDFEE